MEKDNHSTKLQAINADKVKMKPEIKAKRRMPTVNDPSYQCDGT